MATAVSDIRPYLSNEINVPGFEQLPDITNSQLDGYVKDGFWHLRLKGVLSEYTQDDGTGLSSPPGYDVIYKSSDESDLPPEFQRLVAFSGAFRILRLKTLNLAINFTAEAGPVSYEQQASATTLRAILDSLERELAQFAELYSDTLGQVGFHYWDGVLQADYADLLDLPELTVL